MAAGWTAEETKALIGCWGEQNVQEQLDSVRRNRDIYERIAAEMSNLGFTKSWKQCRVKVKNLTQRYRKVKDSNRVSGQGRSSCPFYEEIDAILGTRAASEPPVVLDFGGDTAAVEVPVEEEVTEDREEETTLSEQHIQVSITPSCRNPTTSPAPDDGPNVSGASSSTHDSTEQAATDTTVRSDNDVPVTSACSSSENASKSKSSTAPAKRGVKRKVGKREGDLKEAIQMLGELDRKEEERYEEREHKRMMTFLEAEERRRAAYAEEQQRHRAEERRHEQQMQFMFMSFMQQMLSGTGHHQPSPHYPFPTPPNTFPTSSPYFPSPPSVPLYPSTSIATTSGQAYPPESTDSTTQSPGPFYSHQSTGDNPSGATFSPQSFYEPSP